MLHECLQLLLILAKIQPGSFIFFLQLQLEELVSASGHFRPPVNVTVGHPVGLGSRHADRRSKADVGPLKPVLVLVNFKRSIVSSTLVMIENISIEQVKAFVNITP